jgi:hypothetical protein
MAVEAPLFSQGFRAKASVHRRLACGWQKRQESTRPQCCAGFVARSFRQTR